MTIFEFAHNTSILRNIITAFVGRTNISVVCMAKLADVFIYCICYMKYFNNLIFLYS